jgi:hypothetical protein
VPKPVPVFTLLLFAVPNPVPKPVPVFTLLLFAVVIARMARSYRWNLRRLVVIVRMARSYRWTVPEIAKNSQYRAKKT